MIQNVFFDLDNTLWDHRKNAYFTIKDIFEAKEIKRLYGIDFEYFHKKYDEINEALWVLLRDGKIDKKYLKKNRFPNTFLELGIDNPPLSEYFESNFLDNDIKHSELVDGAKDILNYLSYKGYNLHIISNGFVEVTHKKIETSGINNFFKTIVTADDIGVRKPNPKIFEYSLKNASAQKNNSILIGDDYIADAKGAQNFGIDVIFFNSLNETISEEGLKIIKSLSEIKNIL